MALLAFLLGFAIKGFYAMNDGRKSYGGYQVWKVGVGENMTEEVHNKFLDRDVFERDNNSFNFLLSGNESGYWKGYLRSHNMTYEVVLDDVQRRIDEVMTSEARRVDFKTTLSWSKQPTLTDVNMFLKNMVSANGTYCNLSTIGKTSHKKDIFLLKISNGNRKNKAIFIEAGMHGREWTGVLSALILIENIGNNFTAQPDYVQNLDWYIVPLTNPDGYEYSMNTDRLWRKNRRRFSGACYGVDVNRNFDINWAQRGSSRNICSQYYCGPQPFSEEESRAIKNLVAGKRFLAYVSIHSSGTKVLYPWNFGYNGAAPTADYRTHVSVTLEMVKTIRAVAHAHFTNGNIQKVGMKHGSGMSMDWVYFVQNVVHSYIIETRGRVGLDLLDWHEVTIAVREVAAGVMKLAQMSHH